jgi:hypothetical protein
MEEGFNFTPILVPLVALLVGWAIGFFDSNLRTSKKIKEAEASAQIAIRDAKDKIAQAEAKMASIAATPVTVDDPGLMRIKNESGAMTLDLDGVRVNTSAFSHEQRKRLIEMLNVMRPWLEGKPSPAAPVTTPPPPSKPAPASVHAASPAPQPVPVKPAQITSPAIVQNKKDEPSTGPTTMVGQINAILQERITGTKFANPGVVLLETPAGGVNVYVGLNKFEGIDSVPDEEIKSVIRAAIAEWEKKYTPGLG